MTDVVHMTHLSINAWEIASACKVIGLEILVYYITDNNIFKYMCNLYVSV